MAGSRPALLAWSGSSGPERIELYTRWSLYLVIGFAPGFLLLWASPLTDLGTLRAVVFMATSVLHAVVAVATVRVALSRGATLRDCPRSLLTALAAVTVLLVAQCLTWVDGASDAGLMAATLAMIFTGGAIAPAVRTGALLRGALVGTAVLIGVAAARHDWYVSAGAVVAVVSLALIILPTFRLSAWMLEVVWELDEARVTFARLAVSEERLRFSRDLHDVVGRHLSAIAVKSELAAQLADRGLPGSGEQMLEVRGIAHEALAETRDVVVGYGSAGLSAELAGAQSLLWSAGIRMTVAGDDIAQSLPQADAEALAWVVREGVTNIVRHSTATSAELTLAQEDDMVTLTLVNDEPRSAMRPGSGLAGLASRLEPRGAQVTHEHAGDAFRLEVRLPTATAPRPSSLTGTEAPR